MPLKSLGWGFVRSILTPGGTTGTLRGNGSITPQLDPLDFAEPEIHGVLRARLFAGNCRSWMIR